MEYTNQHDRINWDDLKADLIQDDFHNGRTTAQLKTSFENSQIVVYGLENSRCIATARALSDGVCNCYVIDVWTHSNYRQQGIASHMMNSIIDQVPGQHIYLQTDDAITFYKKLGFQPQPEGLSIVSGLWLQNDSR